MTEQTARKESNVMLRVKGTMQTNIKEWAKPEVVRGGDQAEHCHILPGGSRQDTTLAVPVKKRKADVMVEAQDKKKKKFVFNKRGKLKDAELKELSRTSKNIFKTNCSPSTHAGQGDGGGGGGHGRGRQRAGGEAGES